MHDIPNEEQQLHKLLVGQSYETYLQLRSQGLEVTPNPLVSEKRYVGGNNKLYPDIVVWRPNSPGSQEGTAVMIEQIETSNSINRNVERWRELASTGINFTLVVPLTNLDEVRNLLSTNNISVNKLQTYEYNQATNRFLFGDIG